MKISIMGCGWLGLPLAERFIENGHTVKGSTTSTGKLDLFSEKGIDPYLIKLTPELNSDHSDAFWNSDVLIVNIPPGRKQSDVIEYHTQQIRAVADRLEPSSISFVVFVSSTSVYPRLAGIVCEGDTGPGRAARDSGNALLQAEEMLIQRSSFDTTVVRCGGLYGYDRNPAGYLAARKNLDRGNAPVNLIHRDDCINILELIIEKDIRGEVLNAVSDGHPPRKMFYKAMAEAAGVQPPTFTKDENKDYKVVSNKKLKKKLDYQFEFPNPMDG